MRRALRALAIFLAMHLCLSASCCFSQEDVAGTADVLSLDRCVQICLKRNFSLMQALELLIEKEADYYVSMSDNLATKVGSYYKNGTTVLNHGYEEMEAKGELSYKMPLGDTVRASSEIIRTNFTDLAGYDLSLEYRHPMAKGYGPLIGWKEVRKSQRNWTIQELQYFLSKQGVVSEVIRKYFTLLQSKKLIDVNEEAVKSARENLRITKKKFDEGMVSKIDLTRAEILLVESQDGLLSAQKTWQDSRDSLLLTMGLDARRKYDIDYTVPYTPSDFLEEECLDLALLVRKELMVSGEDLIQNQENVVIAKNNLMPQLDLVGGYGATRKDFLFGSGSTGSLLYPAWNARIEFSIDISKRALREELLKAQRLVALAEQKIADQKREIVKEVREYIRLVNLNQNKVRLREENLRAAEERLHLAKRSWEEGLINNRELVDAQQALVQAQSQLLRAKIDYIIAEYELRKSIGYDLSYLIRQENREKRAPRPARTVTE
ncbi:MAG: TolC family protein [Candidatus Eremiobacteraeota bacterium]|nr:TolC family protein [Candidatus Eremiobacteraeota bacterium]